MVRVKLTKTLLRREYITNNKSKSQISRELGHSRRSIASHLKKYNIFRTKYSKITKDKLIELYLNQNLTTYKIAEIYQVSRYCIEYKLNIFNIKIKPRKFNIINQNFGSLTVIKFHDKVLKGKYVKERYLCKCKCGKRKICFRNRLLDGRNTSCGCENGGQSKHLNKLHNAPHHIFILDTYEILTRKQWGKLKNTALERGLDFNISYEDCWNLYLKQNRECALTGLPIHFGQPNRASLDRIDSLKGYTIDNVQWIYAKINFMKSSLPQKEFIELCSLVNKNDS